MTREEWRSVRQLAILGDPNAEFTVGSSYADGLSDRNGGVIIKANPHRAVLWYRRAAAHGDASAQNNLGVH